MVSQMISMAAMMADIKPLEQCPESRLERIESCLGRVKVHLDQVERQLLVIKPTDHLQVFDQADAMPDSIRKYSTRIRCDPLRAFQVSVRLSQLLAH